MGWWSWHDLLVTGPQALVAGFRSHPGVVPPPGTWADDEGPDPGTDDHAAWATDAPWSWTGRVVEQALCHLLFYWDWRHGVPPTRWLEHASALNPALVLMLTSAMDVDDSPWCLDVYAGGDRVGTAQVRDGLYPEFIRRTSNAGGDASIPLAIDYVRGRCPSAATHPRVVYCPGCRAFVTGDERQAWHEPGAHGRPVVSTRSRPPSGWDLPGEGR